MTPVQHMLVSELVRGKCLSVQFDKVIEKALDADETDGGGYSREALPTEADFVLAYATVPG